MDRRQFLTAGAAAAAGVLVAGPLARAAGATTTAATPQLAAPAPLAAPTWWRTYWTDGKAPLSRRTWNVGTFNFYGAQQQQYAAEMGAAPEFLGTNCTGNGGAIARARNWDGVIGGPVAAGAGTIARDTQPDLRPTALASWPARTWAGLYLTTAPMGLDPAAALSTWRQIAAGTHDAKYQLMGARFRKAILDRGHPVEDVIMRPNWEFNQDTGLQPNFYRTCRDQGRLDTSAATTLYNTMMEHFAAAFRTGYGHRMPIALSPAMQSIDVEFIPYGDWLAARDVYDLVCASFHPTPDRCRTAADAQSLVDGRPGWYTPNLAVQTAIAHGLGASFLEHSTDPQITKGSLRYTADAYRHFGQLLARYPNYIAFTGVLNARMIEEDGLVGYRDPATGRAATAEQIAEWRSMVQIHKARFAAV